MTQSYSATGVKTNMAYSKPDFLGKLFNTYNTNHLFTILSINKGIINWTGEIIFEGEGAALPGKVTIYGVGFERKVGNKIFYDLNGSGIHNVKGNFNGAFIDINYSVYTTAVGELCKSGNFKVKVNANGTAIKAVVNGIIITDFKETWSLNSKFCAKRLIK
jgi:hypothetical protein